jgi:hypothetical protein
MQFDDLGNVTCFKSGEAIVSGIRDLLFVWYTWRISGTHGSKYV